MTPNRFQRARPAARPLVRVLAALVVIAARPAPAAPSSALDFWSIPRHGANCQNSRVTAEYWRAARKAGIEFVRLVPDGWTTRRRDFLVGDADDFSALDTTDVTRLRQVLDDAESAGVRVVLTMFSLPGARWRQKNGDQDDGRLWNDAHFRVQACNFWRQLAAALRGHPALAAYNPLNEPHPERFHGLTNPDSAVFARWYARARGSAADLNLFNRDIVAAIRASDPETPILLDGWSYASADGLTWLEPVDDARTLYAFHVYEPWTYTTFRVNRGRYSYPDHLPGHWNAATAEGELAKVERWATRHAIPRSRIAVAEFGVDRRVPGARDWLRDWVARFDAHGWHWAFYSFRSDNWDGMDYELGTGRLGAAYWEAVERGADAELLKHRGPNELWDVLARALDRK